MATKSAAALKALPQKPAKDDKAAASAMLAELLASNVQPVARTRGKTPMAEVTGLEEVVSEYLKRAREIESLESLQSVAEAQIKPKAAEERLGLEENTGKGIRSVVVKGKRDEFLRVTWQDKYKDMNIALADALKQAFGENFNVLFNLSHETKLREGADVEALKCKLGADFAKFFDEGPERLRMASGAMDTRATLRSKLSVSQAAALDKVFATYQYDASVNPPK